jgi:hypothetical protein
MLLLSIWSAISSRSAIGQDYRVGSIDGRVRTADGCSLTTPLLVSATLTSSIASAAPSPDLQLRYERRNLLGTAVAKDGRFTLTNLPPGRYEVDVLPGDKPDVGPFAFLPVMQVDADQASSIALLVARVTATLIDNTSSEIPFIHLDTIPSDVTRDAVPHIWTNGLHPDGASRFVGEHLFIVLDNKPAELRFFLDSHKRARRVLVENLPPTRTGHFTVVSHLPDAAQTGTLAISCSGHRDDYVVAVGTRMLASCRIDGGKVEFDNLVPGAYRLLISEHDNQFLRFEEIPDALQVSIVPGQKTVAALP